MRYLASLDVQGKVPEGRSKAIWLIAALASALLGLGLARLDPLMMGGAVIGVLALLLVLCRPFIGLLLFTVLFILRPAEIWPMLDSLHLERVIGAVTLFGMFFIQYQREGRIALDASRQTKLLLAFALAVMLSVPFAYWRALAVQGLIDVIRIIVYYLMVIVLVNSSFRLRAFTATFCIMITFVCVSSLYGYFHGGSFFAQGIDRAVGITSFGDNPNELGTTLASALPVFLLMASLRSLRALRLVVAGLALAMVVGVVLTGSRASMLGLLGGVAFLCWRSRHRVLALCILVCLAVVGFVVMPEQYQHRYASIVKKSSGGREAIWFDGLKMLQDRPFFGVGVRCYGTARGMKYAEGAGDYTESHSLYFQVLGELGLIGAVAFFSFLIEMLRLNRRTAKILAANRTKWVFERKILDAIFAGLVVLLISGVFGHSLLRRTWYVYAAMGLSIVRIRMLSEDAEPDPVVRGGLVGVDGPT